jgi:hypothetical protein
MLRTILRRKNESAAEAQAGAREMPPYSYRSPEARPNILAARIYRRRYGA